MTTPGLPLLPLGGGVLLAPPMARTFGLGRPASIAAARSAAIGDKLVFAALRDPEGEMSGPVDLFAVGAAAALVDAEEIAPDVVRIVVEAVERVRLETFALQPEGFWRVSITPWVDAPSDAAELRALHARAIERFSALRRRAGLPAVADRLVEAAAPADHPAGARSLPWAAMSWLGRDAPAHWIPIARRQALLEAASLAERLRLLIAILDEADPPASLADDMTPAVLRAADAAGLG